MRVLQVSNFISHHQAPLAASLVATLGARNVRLAATQPLGNDRRSLGWTIDPGDRWMLRAGECAADRDELDRWWREADVVLCGERAMEAVEQRLRRGQLTYYMSERWWKPPLGIARLLHPAFARMALRFRTLAASQSFHFLPVGELAAADMRRLGAFRERMWRWGYFTSVPEPTPSCDRERGPFRVLWAGRMLGCKRVDTLVKAFARVLAAWPSASLTLVGHGPEMASLERLASRYLPADAYQFLPARPVREVRALMRAHHAYVFPSNGVEGWGAVVNEAMAEGCAVFASESSGAANTLIEHGVNGWVFRSGDCKRLAELLTEAARDEALRLRVARAGQRTIIDGWAPRVAADRFLSVSEALLAGAVVPDFPAGPMSRA